MVSQQSEPIAIVGSGCRFPGGANSPSALWKLLENPRDVCVPIPPERFDTTGFYHPDGSHHGTTNVQHSYLMQEDLRMFDAAFFNISPNEADSIDPQQRLLMETVYEALEAGGHTLDSLRGSDTAVYVGTMGVDYNDTLLRDLNTIPTYFATGTNRAIISNRISYFFDWHGPSMTIDTACSSSLIAVHQGVRALRGGESRMAVACGTQVILGPEAFIFESKMKMLSPTGRSRMWDADADGYARGEGVAVVVLKRLSDAIADGDYIECLIRETGANQDGYSNGITVPSTDAQVALIRQTYARAGLDPTSRRDRPQFFEAHGTGTKAGDPKEAAAIHKSFGERAEDEEPLYVGSVKTVIGHTEGAAGLAGLLKASKSIQHGYIPPNLLFQHLNPAIEQFYSGLHVPTSLTPWPRLLDGVPRRASVNSFGFGGSNAHAILEEYKPVIASSEGKPGHPFTPFVFSAASHVSLAEQLQAYSDYLQSHREINVLDLAYTLQSRRSHLPIKISFSATTLEQLLGKINGKLAELKKTAGSVIGSRSHNRHGSPQVLGVFTGQGAQWAAMGAHLIRSSQFVRDRVKDLQASLDTLPPTNHPQWKLEEELLAYAEKSRIAEAAISQPLCTVIQIVLIDILESAGITFNAVVGHSSGEIAAAYAAGFLSAQDAVRIAYYRGYYAHLAGNKKTNQKGSMMAVGTSLEDAQELINLRAFKGRLTIAAHNSASSVTLSGDTKAILLAKNVFDEEKKFARLLKVDTAYHSHHMFSCADAYTSALQSCGITVNQKRKENCAWFSSVTPSATPMQASEDLAAVYWKDNMTQTVLFADAVRNAVISNDQLAIALEIGPHPALKGPALQNISEIRPAGLPYSGVLARERNDIESFSDALGFVWSHIGTQGVVDFQSVENTLSGVESHPQLVTGLPSYRWNHGRLHWHESRRSRKIRGQKQPFHEVLGMLSPDSTARDKRWTNVLKVSEIPWLSGHQLQGQTVFPAAGYVAMALEAAKTLADNTGIQLLELENLSIPKAVTFEEDGNSGVETLVTLTNITTTLDGTTADFSCYSCPVSGSDQEMELMASGQVKAVFGASDSAALSSAEWNDYCMSEVDADRFYASLEGLGYGYYGSFRGMSSLKRRLNQSSVLVDTYQYTDEDSSLYTVHPTMLDVAFQASMLAYSAPGDERLWSLHVPTSIRRIRVDPDLCGSLPTSGSQVPVRAVVDDSESFCASIDIFCTGSQHAMIQVEDLTIKPFAPASQSDDRQLFSRIMFDVASPDGDLVVKDIRPTAAEIKLAEVCERVSYYYVRKWKSEITDDEWSNGQPHHHCLRDYVNHTLVTVSSGEHPCVKKEWSDDTREEIEELINQYSNSVDVRIISAVGENIPAAVRGETTILEHMLPDNMLDDFYKKGLGFARYNLFLASMMKQLVHRYPHARILEIGAGTGGATKSVLESIKGTFSSYTYTDVSVGFFQQASELFKAYSDKMSFEVLDIEKPPGSQGFELQSFDIIVASNVLHATASLQRTLENTRQLLKPGGYLMLLELTDNGPIRCSNTMGGLPGWWLGVDDGRKYAPTITPGQWHSLLRKAGFGGIDSLTPAIDPLPWPFSIMAAQALDDRVKFLRRPLRTSQIPSAVYIESLVILGGSSLQSARIAEELEEYLDHFCGQITVLEGLPSADDMLNLPPMSTVINLVDIDSPIFKGITTEKMDGLKRVYDLARHVLWITAGANEGNAYHMASIAFNRAMSHEESHIALNHLDVSDLGPGVSKSIAEHLLRQHALDEWNTSKDKQQSQQTLWSNEPETLLHHGRLMIPRLISNPGQNARLNSSRRIITKTVPVSNQGIVIVHTPNSTLSLIEESIPSALQSGQELVRVQISSRAALRVAADTFLFLSVGQRHASNNTVLTLSATNSNWVNPIASVELDTSASIEGLLVAVASDLLAASLLEKISSQSSVLIHCSGKDRFLAKAISQRAARKSIRVTFTCNERDTDLTDDLTWIKLKSHAPRHVLRRTIKPFRATHFLDWTLDSSELSLAITSILEPGCKQLDVSDLCRPQSLTCCDGKALIARLDDAVSSVLPIPQNQVQDLVIELETLQERPRNTYATAVIRWKMDGNVNVETQPLETQRLFSKAKTYLLVGLSGQIGQSLCEWMVQNGAGCVCLTSRNPQIEKKWLDSFETTDAKVKVFAMDVTQKKSVEKAVQEIRATCPPIGGVANGAMVLKDSLFSNMSVESMQSVLGPKIDGTNNLDQIFHDDDLDFFILFSSSAGVIGNSGQSNYSAANGYLNGIAKQRRKRGLAASAMDIGRVVGIGYVETAGQAVMQQLNRFGLMAISEREIQQIFAETIRTGYPDPSDKDGIPDAVVTTGIRTICEDEDIQGPWFDNPLFAHSIVQSRAVETTTENQNKRLSLPVTEQLAMAATKEDAFEVLQDCFAAKLQIILQISDQAIDYGAPLVELGLDSLVAVEVRSWFLKEIKVDIPVLKVVGGASLADLCQLALKKLPEELVATIGTGQGPDKQPVGSKPVKLSQPTPPSSSKVPLSDTSAVSESGSITPSIPSGDDSLTDGIVTPPSAQLSSSSSSTGDYSQVENRKATPALEALIPTKSLPVRKFLRTEHISFGQSRFWFLRLLLKDQTAFSVAFYYRISGKLRIGDLERAIRVVTARHEALRTCFVGHETEPDQAYQKVMSSSTLRLQQKNIQSIEDVVIEYEKLKKHTFDLESGDLMRLILLSLSPSSHYLLVNYHHILMDGVSFQIFLSDLEKVYNGTSLGIAPQQFPSFSVTQRKAFETGEMDEDLAYWRNVFPAGEDPPVLPLLPMARTVSRVAMKDFDVYQVGLRLDPAVAARVRAISKAQRSTPFHFYLAAFKVLLFAFTDVQDLTIGIADANRNDSTVMGSIGFFLNLLTLRFKRQPGQSFQSGIVEARNTTYAGLQHSRLPFDVLLKELNVSRSSSYSPFFQVFFDYRQGAQEKHPWGNTQFEFQDAHPGRTGYDITLDITDSATDALIMFRAQKSLYDVTAVNLLMQTYTHLLETLSSDASLSLKDTPLFGEKQLKNAVKVGRGPDLFSDWPETLPHRIDQIAEANQDKLALRDGIGGDLTYGAMIARIQAISEELLAAEVGAGCPVLVYQTAASDWVCSMLAIMRINAIYVPLDLRNPTPRLATIAAECAPAAILADNTTVQDVPQLGVSSAYVINVSLVGRRPSIPIANSAQADSPAAYLFTSGSTGTPKGIVIKHSSLQNEIEGYTKTWKLGAERSLQQSAFTFNHSSDQIYTALVNGGMVYVVPWSKRGDALEITKIIQDNGITYTKATPSEYSLWIEFGGDNLRHATGWRHAFGGGEPLTKTLIRGFANLELPQLRLFNSYGPTEISISSTKMEIEYRNQDVIEDSRIPCGYSLPNYHTYVVDEDLKPLPTGMPGELCIGGAGVSLGYLNNVALTSQQFVSNPFATPADLSNGWTHMYRTGDIGHLRDDGAMVFHSRMAGDTQIKIRGLRIELSDIERNIAVAADGALKEVIVTLREGDPDFLVAHVVFASQHDITDKEVFLQHLLERLPIPQYMIPVAAIPLEQMPLTNHSKVDRAALRSMPLPQQPKRLGDNTKLSPLMSQLKLVWQDVLRNNDLNLEITPSSSFFLVGGNSLLVIRLQQRIHQVFNVVIGLVELLGSNTLSQMANRIEESVNVETIDWEEETTPPTIPHFLNSVSVKPVNQHKTRTVLVTGGTSYLARYLLPQLVARPDVARVYCIAVRDKPAEGVSRVLQSPKILSYKGDLSAPLLGLTEQDFSTLASEADVIFHMGAVRSFWDNYHVLRPSNVHPTKELVKLATRRRIPIHYISSFGVIPSGSDMAAVSAAAHIPATDGSNGYVATRWASERILERATQSLGFPTSIYRFLPSASRQSQDQPSRSPSTDVLDQFVHFVDVTGTIPDMNGWTGRIDMVSAEQAASWLAASLLRDEADLAGTTRFTHFESMDGVDVDQLAAYIEEKRGGEGLKQMPGLKWIGQIKRLGFDRFLTTQEVILGATEGAQWESRR